MQLLGNLYTFLKAQQIMFNILHLLVRIFFGALALLVIVNVLMSWIPVNPDNPVSRFTNKVVSPIQRPLDRRIPTVGVINIVPLILLWGLIFTMTLILYALPNNW